ncbi:MAG: lipopolysaccharide kinase InaA family protein [Ilumatobacteraceae bacterium]
MTSGRSSGDRSSQPIQHSPADILRLVVAGVVVLILLAVEWLFGDTLVAFASDLLRGLDAVPQWIIAAIVIGTRILGVIVLGGGLAWILYRRRWRMLATIAIAGLLAVAMLGGLDPLVETESGLDLFEVNADLGPLTTDGHVSTAGITAVAAMLTAAAPWLGRRARRAGWTLIVGLVVTAFIQAPVSFDSILAWIVGWLCGAAVLVVGGAPSRRPTMQAVIDGLDAVGLPMRTLERAGVDARGSVPYFGVGADGTKLFVKALGTDDRSADLLFRAYRRLQPHDLGDEKPFNSLRRSVEHEAFVALIASARGVRTPALLAMATADPNGYVLAYEAIEGKSLDRLDPSDVSDDILAAIWNLVGQLRDHHIAHRDLRLANIFLDDDGHAWLIDFGFSEVAASDLLLATDVAELLASSSVYVGPERAVAHAAAAADRATLALALHRLHRWSLSGATRTALKARPGLLDDLRNRMTEAIAASTP